MLKLLFWNLQGANHTDDCVRKLVDQEKPTLVGLAEYTRFTTDNLPSGYKFQRLSPRLAILCNVPFVIEAPHDKRLRQFVQLVSIDKWKIAICHFKSILNDGEAERNSLLRRLKFFLLEQKYDWRGIVIMGDMNCNPWDSGILDKESLHGLQTRTEAATPMKYSGQVYPALINESYQLARPIKAGPGEVWGTYKHKEVVLHSSLRWHILDQVLVSPDVEAIVSTKTELPGIPWYKGLGSGGKSPIYPDHLPIVVELNQR